MARCNTHSARFAQRDHLNSGQASRRSPDAYIPRASQKKVNIPGSYNTRKKNSQPGIHPLNILVTYEHQKQTKRRSTVVLSVFFASFKNKSHRHPPTPPAEFRTHSSGTPPPPARRQSAPPPTETPHLWGPKRPHFRSLASPAPSSPSPGGVRGSCYRQALLGRPCR